ncbi:hypothetical protein KIN20_006817 [Parelaphostrongylus tenuis]|uniref:Uncharacterized protein n=1 Tax=Parelaphostrongylus tenuis TaxID=148309 RepID=A0AAD5MKZ3_PARTN|nr:hypothetical protein KIN20_006817 [Parelaphostrongylus tenuis]
MFTIDVGINLGKSRQPLFAAIRGARKAKMAPPIKGYHILLDSNQTINGENYTDELEKLVAAMREKGPRVLIVTLPQVNTIAFLQEQYVRRAREGGDRILTGLKHSQLKVAIVMNIDPIEIFPARRSRRGLLTLTRVEFIRRNRDDLRVLLHQPIDRRDHSRYFTS